MSQTAAASKSERKKILLVDDDAAMLELLDSALGSAGHELTSCATGAAALQAVSSVPFDLLLLDLGLPDVHGLDLMERVRRLAPATRVIVITADNTFASLLTAIRSQVYEYLRKPFDLGELKDIVRCALTAADEPPIEVLSGHPDWFELSLPCTRHAVDRTERFVRQLAPDLGEVTASLIQAVRELLLNAVEWGGGLDPQKRVRLCCVHTPRLLFFRIADPGPGFRFDDLEQAAAGADGVQSAVAAAEFRARAGMRPGGLGIRLAQAVADDLIYNEQQNEVILVKYLDTRPAR
jgi:DNA-binding response OmpR family regulator